MIEHGNKLSPADADLVRLAAGAIYAKKGFDLAAYDVSALSSVTDCHLVVSGMTATHIKALCSEARAALKTRGAECYRQSGRPESGWIIADYVSFIIHFFLKDSRAYYAFDVLWQGAPRIELNLPEVGRVG